MDDTLGPSDKRPHAFSPQTGRSKRIRRDTEASVGRLAETIEPINTAESEIELPASRRHSTESPLDTAVQSEGDISTSSSEDLSDGSSYHPDGDNTNVSQSSPFEDYCTQTPSRREQSKVSLTKKIIQIEDEEDDVLFVDVVRSSDQDTRAADRKVILIDDGEDDYDVVFDKCVIRIKDEEDEKDGYFHGYKRENTSEGAIEPALKDEDDTLNQWPASTKGVVDGICNLDKLQRFVATDRSSDDHKAMFVSLAQTIALAGDQKAVIRWLGRVLGIPEAMTETTREDWPVTAPLMRGYCKGPVCTAAHVITTAYLLGDRTAAVQAARALRVFGVWAPDTTTMPYRNRRKLPPIDCPLSASRILQTIWPATFITAQEDLLAWANETRDLNSPTYHSWTDAHIDLLKKCLETSSSQFAHIKSNHAPGLGTFRSCQQRLTKDFFDGILCPILREQFHAHTDLGALWKVICNDPSWQVHHTQPRDTYPLNRPKGKCFEDDDDDDEEFPYANPSTLRIKQETPTSNFSSKAFTNIKSEPRFTRSGSIDTSRPSIQERNPITGSSYNIRNGPVTRQQATLATAMDTATVDELYRATRDIQIPDIRRFIRKGNPSLPMYWSKVIERRSNGGQPEAPVVTVSQLSVGMSPLHIRLEQQRIRDIQADVAKLKRIVQYN